MTETTGEIKAHIRDTRENLDADLNELGQKVKSATDWRQHYQKSPFLFLAAALGGGLLLAHATKGRRSRPVSALPAAPPQAAPSAAKDSAQMPYSVGIIKGALIGLAATQVKNALSQFLPGFEAQLAKNEEPKHTPQEEPIRRPAPGNGSSTSAPG